MPEMIREIEDILADQPQTDFVAELSEAQVASFQDRGFTSIERITTDEEVAWLREVYDWLFAEKSRALKGLHFDLVRPYDSEGEDRLPQIIAPEQRLPQLKQTAFWRNGRLVASRLLGVDPELLQGWGHMIRKPPKIGEPLPWHQDEAYWDPALVYRATGCWLPLDDATIENGCMSFIPGSHANDVLPHRHVNDDPSVHALFTEPDPADIARAVPVPVPAGGAVFHQPRTLHASGPNITDKVRRAYANEWQLTPAKAAAAAERPWIDEHKKAWAARELS
jgi:ectoine hydroxylase-related dioxygenase (phytanoyl-CoA dioxygenase family)